MISKSTIKFWSKFQIYIQNLLHLYWRAKKVTNIVVTK